MSEVQDMNELLINQVSNLPPFPSTVQELKQYIDKEGSDVVIDKVAQIISRDPIVTAHLLQLANSPFYGFSRQIATIHQVINLLGVNNVKNTILADSLKENYKIDLSPYGIVTQKFLENCSLEVEFISNWLLQEDKRLSYLLVPCAMLLRLGMIVFSNFLIQTKKDREFLEALKKNNFQNIAMVENDFFGVDHISFLGFLFHRWDFDEVLVESICFMDLPHSADDSIKKNAYALAIASNIFAPYDGGSAFRLRSSLELIKEAKAQGINFDKNNFLTKLPEHAKRNLEHIGM